MRRFSLRNVIGFGATVAPCRVTPSPWSIKACGDWLMGVLKASAMQISDSRPVCFRTLSVGLLANGRRCLVQFVGIATCAMQPYVMIHHVHKSKTPFCGSYPQMQTHGTESGPCCYASTLCSACNATLAQETLCQLAKLLSLYRPNGKIRAIPLAQTIRGLSLGRKTVGPSLPAGIQSGSDCHTARLGEPYTYIYIYSNKLW